MDNDRLVEIVYRIDERLKALDEINADVKEVRNELSTIARQVAVDHERVNDIQDRLKTARHVSWSAIATSVVGAIVTFFTGR